MPYCRLELPGGSEIQRSRQTAVREAADCLPCLDRHVRRGRRHRPADPPRVCQPGVRLGHGRRDRLPPGGPGANEPDRPARNQGLGNGRGLRGGNAGNNEWTIESVLVPREDLRRSQPRHWFTETDQYMHHVRKFSNAKGAAIMSGPTQGMGQQIRRRHRRRRTDRGSHRLGFRASGKARRRGQQRHGRIRGTDLWRDQRQGQSDRARAQDRLRACPSSSAPTPC